MMVLTETDRWLGQVADTLGRRANPTPLESKILLLANQAKQYLHFSYDPQAVDETFPPVSPAKIDNNIGSGITQYAYAGAIGPDFPAAAEILALNQRWVAETMHKGSPRRALKDAGTTEFVLSCISQDVFAAVTDKVRTKKDANAAGGSGTPKPDDKLLSAVAQYKKPMMAYLLGHLSSVATHVIIEPFIDQWAWSQDNADRAQFVTQLDAQIAKGYFQRKDLHSGQSWTAYLPSAHTGQGFWGYIGNDPDSVAVGVRMICELYLRGFTDTYGGFPRESLCKFPKYDEIKAKFPGIDAIADGKLHFRGAIDIYTGYDGFVKQVAVDVPIERDVNQDLAKDAGPPKTVLTAQGVVQQGAPPKDPKAPTPGEAALTKEIESVKGLASFLHYDNECKAPELDRNFLVDGYRNTRDWAISAGYDHVPWVSPFVMSAAVLIGSLDPLLIGVTTNVWDTTTAFKPNAILGAIFTADFEKKQNAQIAADNLKAWQDHGMFGNEKMWFDILDQSYSASGPILFLFNSLLTGIPIPAWLPIVGLLSKVPTIAEGLFGHGTDDSDARSGGKRAYMILTDVVSPPLFPVLATAFPEVFRFVVVRWVVLLILGIGNDGLEVLSVNHGDTSKGIEGDRLGLRIWYLKLWMTGAYALSSLLVFGHKAASGDRQNDKDLDGSDYLLGLIGPLVMIAYKVIYKGGFDRELVKEIAGVDWPTTDTDKVDATILPIEPSSQPGRMQFSTSKAGRFPVRVFDNKPEVMKQPTGLNQYYPQDEADDIPWDDIPKRDDLERSRKSHPTTQTYQFKELLDSAAMFSGLLAMAAVNYDTASDRNLAKQIFKDWNLNFRTDDEWADLMENRVDGTPGFVKAMSQWWSAISASTPTTPDPSAVVQLEIAMGLTPGPVVISGQVEDRSVAPNNNSADTAHVFLANTPYSIVDATGKVVASGKTDDNGGLEANLPGPADYQLRIEGFQGLAG